MELGIRHSMLIEGFRKIEFCAKQALEDDLEFI
jgi:hypothetical protein